MNTPTPTLTLTLSPRAYTALIAYAKRTGQDPAYLAATSVEAAVAGTKEYAEYTAPVLGGVR